MIEEPLWFGPVAVDPARCGDKVNIMLANGHYDGAKNTDLACKLNVPLSEVLDTDKVTMCYQYVDLGLGFTCQTTEDGSATVNCSWSDRAETEGDATIWACNQMKDHCDDPAKWREITRFNVKAQNLKVTLPDDKLPNGCYRFSYLPLQNGEAILGGDPNANPSYPHYRPELGEEQQCLPVLRQDACGDGNCLRCQVKAEGTARQASQAQISAAACTVYNQDTGQSCVTHRQTMEDGSQLLLLNPTLCGEKATLSVTNVPEGYAKTEAGEFPCVRAAPYGELTAQASAVECTMAAGRAAGDADGDNQVNLKDFAALKKEFGKTPDKADFNGDGIVDLKDFAILKKYFGLQTK